LNLKKLDEELFQYCLELKKESQGKIPFWRKAYESAKGKGLELKDPEDLRDAVRKECKKRKITFEQNVMDDKQNLNRFAGPRVGVCDIETLPGIGFYFDIFNTNIGIDQIITDTCMLGWAGKFLNEPEMYSDIMTSKEAKERDTTRITKSIWEFLSKCDYVVGHNFQSFDRPFINTEFLKHGLSPLKYTVIDTLLISRQNFKMDSNKLKFIAQKMDMQRKIDNSGFPLWRSCSDGKQEALDEMKNYNLGDILSTEDWFYLIRPYVKNLNVALFNEISDPQCPVCGSTNLKQENYFYTYQGKWNSIRCLDCKCVSRSKENLLAKDKKKSLLINS